MRTQFINDYHPKNMISLLRKNKKRVEIETFFYYSQVLEVLVASAFENIRICGIDLQRLIRKAKYQREHEEKLLIEVEIFTVFIPERKIKILYEFTKMCEFNGRSL